MEPLTQIRAELKARANEEIREKTKRFFKETVNSYGLRNPEVTKLTKVHNQTIKAMAKEEVFRLCEELWRSGMMEESLVACHWCYAKRKDYRPEDFSTFERWIEQYVSNWASCDTFCNHSVGGFLESYPAFLSRLDPWTASSNRWMRRAAAVSLVVPARRGEFLDEVLHLADLLLMDHDDLVQKGYGWMLKEASRTHPNEIFAFVMERKATMPRTALRYAIEKIPPERRKEAMKK